MSYSFIMIGPRGQYAAATYKGGAYGDGVLNHIVGTSDLNAATVFTQGDMMLKPYKQALKEGYTKVPAYATRTVTIGTLEEPTTLLK